MKLNFVYYLQGNKKYLLVGIVFGTVAILMNRMPHWIYEPFESQKSWIRTIANIERIEYNEADRKYEHWVRFKTLKGETVQAKSKSASSIAPMQHDQYYIMYNPANPQDFFNNDLEKNLEVLKVSGFMTLVFGSIALFVLGALGAKLYYESYKPEWLPIFDFWIEIIGGSMGALAFAIPALFVDVVLWYFTGTWSQAEGLTAILWIFRILGLVVLVALVLMVKHFYKRRPRVKKT